MDHHSRHLPTNPPSRLRYCHLSYSGRLSAFGQELCFCSECRSYAYLHKFQFPLLLLQSKEKANSARFRSCRSTTNSCDLPLSASIPSRALSRKSRSPSATKHSTCSDCLHHWGTFPDLGHSRSDHHICARISVPFSTQSSCNYDFGRRFRFYGGFSDFE